MPDKFFIEVKKRHLENQRVHRPLDMRLVIVLVWLCLVLAAILMWGMFAHGQDKPKTDPPAATVKADADFLDRVADARICYTLLAVADIATLPMSKGDLKKHCDYEAQKLTDWQTAHGIKPDWTYDQNSNTFSAPAPKEAKKP
jgi:hypothetical protein